MYSNPTPGHISRKHENSNLKRYMHPNVHRNYLQQPRHGNKPTAHQQKIDLRRCDTHMHTHTHILTGYYSDTKKNEILSFLTRQLNIEKIILSEMSHTEKEKYMLSLLCRNVQNIKIICESIHKTETDSQKKRTQGYQRRKDGMRDK